MHCFGLILIANINVSGESAISLAYLIAFSMGALFEFFHDEHRPMVLIVSHMKLLATY